MLRQLWSPELEDLRQYVRSVPTNVLMGMSAFAALSTYWYATRPRAIPARCDLAMQSVEVPVGHMITRHSELTVRSS